MLDHGKCGLLAQPDNPKSMAEAVINLLVDRGLASSLANAARAKVLADYDKEKSMDKISQIYNEGYRAALK
jgi:glycosyltransferase involved in cell wall biosynthesis